MLRFFWKDCIDQFLKKKQDFENSCFCKDKKELLFSSVCLCVFLPCSQEKTTCLKMNNLFTGTVAQWTFTGSTCMQGM